MASTTGMPVNRILRDMNRRTQFASNELMRMTYKYIARNTTLPPPVRHQAQLKLNEFPKNAARPVFKSRCVASAKGHSVFTEYGLSRVCAAALRFACFWCLRF